MILITVNPDTPHTSREEEEESRPPSPPSEDMILQVINTMWRFNDSYSVSNVVCIISVLYVCPHSHFIPHPHFHFVCNQDSY